ncbi:subclass B1 metallo-beta-lactamase [Lewinella sp. IMCC34191]|uniref:subclass B1 metallo-beta-lactamase n=1 Tax=Lewinella sp. IMCC34191 TaxID=2259172 RepID=UPI000E266B98|nr:subclass B1 metallo-beta-lactamase [Lewinella sp. IMCC34191]
MKYPLALLLFALLLRCAPTPSASAGYATENLRVDRVTDRTYVHVTYLDTDDFGRVPCNGLIVVEDGEAIVYDSPATDAAATELIDYISETLDAEVKAVVATHFHVDCLGGFAAFRERDIPTYATEETARLAREQGFPAPLRTFDESLELNAGKLATVTVFTGPGHTRDNVVGYVPREEVLFGGCLVKAMGAGKGNLADADTSEWANTIVRLSEEFPRARYVVPGHGAVGGPELLDYTRRMFSPE